MRSKWRIVLLLTVLCFGALLSSGLNVDKSTDGFEEEEFENEHKDSEEDRLTVEVPGSPIRRLVDPHGTWLAFMRHSERTNKRHRAKNARRTKKLSGVRGPRGPQGPQGPPGQPGAQITKDILIQEFRDLVREAAERRIQSITDSHCQDCDKPSTENITGHYVPALFDIQEALLVPKLVWGFHCRLEEEAKIPKHVARMELKGFYVPFVQGGFQRGDGINPQEGRFTVSRKGIYNFVANLHVRHRSLRKQRTLKSAQKADVVRAMICINSRCLQEASLESAMQLSPVPWRGSIVISGYLELQKGQYVSIFIDNSDSEALIIQDSSYFTGSLVGV